MLYQVITFQNPLVCFWFSTLISGFKKRKGLNVTHATQIGSESQNSGQEIKPLEEQELNTSPK